MLNASTKLCELVQPYHKDHVASFLKVFCCSNCTTCQVCSRCGFFVALFLTCSCALCAMWIVCICVQICVQVCSVHGRCRCSICKTSHRCTGTAAIQMGVNCCKIGMQPGVKLGLHAQSDARESMHTSTCMWAAVVPEILFYNYIWEIRFCFYPK